LPLFFFAEFLVPNCNRVVDFDGLQHGLLHKRNSRPVNNAADVN
jgi:hypothetical protein